MTVYGGKRFDFIENIYGVHLYLNMFKDGKLKHDGSGSCRLVLEDIWLIYRSGFLQ